MATSLATDGVTFGRISTRGTALFQWEGRTLVLVPGRTVQLGWNRGPLSLTAEQRKAWRDGLKALWDFDETPEALLDEDYSPSRTVEMPSLLVQQAPDAVDAEALLYDDDGDDLDVDPFEALHARLGRSFRLPSPDEWEYLYRAGVSTLFPWGDAWPEGSSDGRTVPTVMRDPNAFGLSFDYDTYTMEVVAAELRGGDGGSDVCGGVPEPVDWRCLACAFQPSADLWTDVLEISLEQALFRRVRPVTLSPING